MTFDTYKKRLGQRLLDLRGRAELTQVEVAAKAKLTRQHLQRLEYGNSNPKLETLFELARVYGVTVSEIVDL
jgi:transcriptional regulator with XRE-family HTH domain